MGTYGVLSDFFFFGKWGTFTVLCLFVFLFFFLIFASAICLSNYCIVFLRFFHVVKLNTVHNY